MIDLTPFCSPQDDPRYYLCAPFSDGDFSYATNGHIIVRVPRRADIQEREKAHPSCHKLFIENPAREMIAIPDIPPAPPQIDCMTCEATGKWNDGDTVEKCEDCGGTGKKNARQDIAVGEVHFAAKYLRLIITLPGAGKISPNGTGSAWFTFDGGDGLLMPIRA